MSPSKDSIQFNPYAEKTLIMPTFLHLKPSEETGTDVKYDSGVTCESDSRSPIIWANEVVNAHPKNSPSPSSIDSLHIPCPIKYADLHSIKQQLSKKHFKCKSCEFSMDSREEYYSHVEEHIKGNRYIWRCHICPFVSEHKTHYKYHLMKHAGAKPFKCSFCEYSCINKSMLTSHLKSHSTVCEFKCPKCPYEAKRSHILRKHILRKHHLKHTTSDSGKQQLLLSMSSLTQNALLPFPFGLMPGEAIADPELKQKIEFCVMMAHWHANHQAGSDSS